MKTNKTILKTHAEEVLEIDSGDTHNQETDTTISLVKREELPQCRREL